MNRIAVFTSGGDAPGMNACIRAVVRTALFNQIEVYGILNGYDGMINNEFIQMNASSVANIIQRGGTILKSARSKSFMTIEGREKAKQNLIHHKIEGVVAIGGDGTFKGALEFSKICSIPIVGCPGTIDNDLIGTDYTIGYDTAINNVIEAVDKIRDTAESHNRLFIVEVMGRDAGLIALRAGIGAGAEAILIPELDNDTEQMVQKLENSRKEKSSKIIIVAEGDQTGGAYNVAEIINKRFPGIYDVKVCVLGHLQRGGSPTCMERVNASRMGHAAVNALLQGKKNVMTGIICNEIAFTPFENAVKHITTIKEDLRTLAKVLS
jgi:6-phosphofructokinase 1